MGKPILPPAPDSAKPFTPEATQKQVRWIMEDIASAASIVERLAVIMADLTDEDDQRDIQAYYGATKLLSQRMGWAAELALTKMGEGAMRMTEPGDIAEAWMLPPAYHRDAGQQEVA